VDVRATPPIPGRSATASPTGSRARPCALLASSFGVAELQSFLGGKHAGSLEALRVTRPEAVDLEDINTKAPRRQSYGHGSNLGNTWRRKVSGEPRARESPQTEARRSRLTLAGNGESQALYSRAFVRPEGSASRPATECNAVKCALCHDFRNLRKNLSLFWTVCSDRISRQLRRRCMKVIQKARHSKR
jgi:hypothetical protein